jgi:hypothetical protein
MLAYDYTPFNALTIAVEVFPCCTIYTYIVSRQETGSHHPVQHSAAVQHSATVEHKQEGPRDQVHHQPPREVCYQVLLSAMLGLVSPRSEP